jgi:hypothetical protein
VKSTPVRVTGAPRFVQTSLKSGETGALLRDFFLVLLVSFDRATLRALFFIRKQSCALHDGKNARQKRPRKKDIASRHAEVK